MHPSCLCITPDIMSFLGPEVSCCLEVPGAGLRKVPELLGAPEGSAPGAGPEDSQSCPSCCPSSRPFFLLLV